MCFETKCIMTLQGHPKSLILAPTNRKRVYYSKIIMSGFAQYRFHSPGVDPLNATANNTILVFPCRSSATELFERRQLFGLAIHGVFLQLSTSRLPCTACWLLPQQLLPDEDASLTDGLPVAPVVPSSS